MPKVYDYVVELKRTSYVTVAVTARDDDDAEEQAWEMLDSGRLVMDKGDANWEIESIERGDEYKGEEDAY